MGSVLNNKIIQVLFLFFLLVFTQISFFMMADTVIGNYNYSRTLMAVCIDLGFLIIVGLYAYFYRYNLFEDIKTPTFRDILVCVFITGVVMIIWPFLDIISLVDNIKNGNKIYTLSFHKIIRETNLEQSYSHLRTLVFMPILEEVFYRKIIFEKIRKQYKTITAIIVSSVLFSAGHLDYTFFSTAFFIGIILSLVYLQTKNLLVPIILHSLINLSNGFFI